MNRVMEAIIAVPWDARQRVTVCMGIRDLLCYV
jgi:hypothetical protein